MQGPTNSRMNQATPEAFKRSSPISKKLIQKYQTFFNGIKTLKGYTVKPHINESVKLIAKPDLPIPFHLKSYFKEENRKMKQADTTEEHEGPA